MEGTARCDEGEMLGEDCRTRQIIRPSWLVPASANAAQPTLLTAPARSQSKPRPHCAWSELITCRDRLSMSLLVLPETCSQRRDWITLDLVNMQARVLFRRKVAFHYLHQNFPRIRCHIRVSSSVKPKTHEFGLCTGDYFVDRVAVSGDFDASEVHHLASIAFSLPFPEA